MWRLDLSRPSSWLAISSCKLASHSAPKYRIEVSHPRCCWTACPDNVMRQNRCQLIDRPFHAVPADNDTKILSRIVRGQFEAVIGQESCNVLTTMVILEIARTVN